MQAAHPSGLVNYTLALSHLYSSTLLAHADDGAAQQQQGAAPGQADGTQAPADSTRAGPQILYTYDPAYLESIVGQPLMAAARTMLAQQAAEAEGSVVHVNLRQYHAILRLREKRRRQAERQQEPKQPEEARILPSAKRTRGADGKFTRGTTAEAAEVGAAAEADPSSDGSPGLAAAGNPNSGDAEQEAAGSPAAAAAAAAAVAAATAAAGGDGDGSREKGGRSVTGGAEEGQAAIEGRQQGQQQGALESSAANVARASGAGAAAAATAAAGGEGAVPGEAANERQEQGSPSTESDGA